MFEASFSNTSSTALPPSTDLETALKILHDFESVIKLSPDCRGCKPIPPPIPVKNGITKTNSPSPSRPTTLQYYEVEDELPFIPKRLWAGGVRYTADFLPTTDGCDITIHAPAGFVSTNRWRILREVVPEGQTARLEQVASKDLLHAQTGVGAGGYFVQISSDARCPIAFAAFVRGFLKNSLDQLQLAFIERIRSLEGANGQRKRRPTIGRRRSSEL